MFGFLFPERTWAIRVVERACRDIKSPEATEAIELIVWGAKRFPDMRVPARGRVIAVAIGLWSNPTAARQFLSQVPVTDDAAVAFLRQISEAAVSLGNTEGLGG